MVDDLPEKVEVDITDLVIGSSIKVRDIELDNLSLLDPPNSVIVRVKTSRTVVEDEEDEEEEEGEEGAEGEEGEKAAAATEE